MAMKRLSIRKIREILSLQLGERLSRRTVARSVSISPSTGLLSFPPSEEATGVVLRQKAGRAGAPARPTPPPPRPQAPPPAPPPQPGPRSRRVAAEEASAILVGAVRTGQALPPARSPAPGPRESRPWNRMGERGGDHHQDLPADCLRLPTPKEKTPPGPTKEASRGRPGPGTPGAGGGLGDGRRRHPGLSPPAAARTSHPPPRPRAAVNQCQLRERAPAGPTTSHDDSSPSGEGILGAFKPPRRSVCDLLTDMIASWLQGR